MSNKVIIVISGGCASVFARPDGLEIEIRDYDIEGEWDEDNESCKIDVDKDRYQEMIFPAIEVKPSPEILSEKTKRVYRNFYECTDCGIKWDIDSDRECECECPSCKTTYSPYYYSLPNTKINFSANGKQCFTDVERKLIGWQPSIGDYPVVGLQSFEVYAKLKMGIGCHPEVKEWIEIFEGDIEKPVIIPFDEDDFPAN